MPRKLHWELISLVGALLSATCGTSVRSLLEQDNYREASQRCGAERNPSSMQACHQLVAAELVRALRRHIRWTDAYTFARQECSTLDDLRELQACHRQVADAAFDRAERIRRWETGDSEGTPEYYAYALAAYQDAGNLANRERQKASSYWVAFHSLETGDEAAAKRALQAGNYADAEIDAALVSLCLRRPTSKCVPLAVEHMEILGSSIGDARREVGRQCIAHLAQGVHPDASTCAQIAQTLRRLSEETQALRICFRVCRRTCRDSALAGRGAEERRGRLENLCSRSC